MKSKISFIDWTKIFDKIEENHKIDYNLMYHCDIKFIENYNEAYQTEYYMDIFLEKGSLTLMLDMKEYVINSPTIILVQKNQTLQILSYSDDVSIHYLVVTPQIKKKFFKNHIINISHHNKIKTNHIFPLCENNAKLFVDFFCNVKTYLSITDTPYRIEAVFYLIRSYYFLFYKEKNEDSLSNDFGVCEKFFALLDQYFLTEKNTDFYANRLHLSKGHFEYIIKSNTGSTPRKWLDDKLMKECKKALSETDLPIGEIAEILQFNSIGHFSNFFKRKEGVSPIDFRRKKI